jgi:FMN phosphatase YigB (HAD superfamily)
MPIEAVYFDIGETLVDRSREHAAWANAFGVSPHTYSAVFGAVIASGGSAADVVDRFRRERPGAADHLTPPLTELTDADLFPDVRACLSALHAEGLRLGIVGNQPAAIADQLAELELPVDEIATSGQWGVSKPDAAFFERIVESAGVAATSIVYVGDQIDLDIVPALAAGLRAIRLRRGPWGLLLRDPVVEASCLAVVNDLTEVPAILSSGQERPNHLRARDRGTD